MSRRLTPAASMPNIKHQHDDLVIFDFDDGTVVADTIAPQARFIGRKAFAVRPRRGSSVNVLAKPCQYHPCRFC